MAIDLEKRTAVGRSMLQCCSVVGCDSTGLFVIRVSRAGRQEVATLSRIVNLVAEPWRCQLLGDAGRSRSRPAWSG